MNTRATRQAEIVEVAPRDGFQSIAEPLPTHNKISLIEGLLDAGCQRLELGSFVSPRAVPQMADMGGIAEHFKGRPGLRLSVLVPNAKGAELALAHGIRELVYVFSASETHNLKNVRQTIEQSLTQLAEITAMRRDERDFRLRVDIATCFDCPFDGTVPFGQVRYAVERVAEVAGTAEIALCDTTGRANPHQVRSRFAAVMGTTGEGIGWAFHGHDTFGMGVANALFAYEAGVRTFDASAAGLGGCPFAPGASGNTATEDLVFAFGEAGIHTSIDMFGLLTVADRIAGLPGACVGGHLRKVPRARAIPASATA
ncbi:MAG: hydroxymethylglutaryl-CoA lyase [Aquisalimonadaceae bacterium]